MFIYKLINLKELYTNNIKIALNESVNINVIKFLEEQLSLIKYLEEEYKFDNETINIFLQYFKLCDFKNVVKEQLTYFNKKISGFVSSRKKCENLYYSILFDTDINMPVISMLISVYPEIKRQSHFYIVKNIYYSIYQIFQKKQKQPILRKSSLLLHSFSAYMFNSDYWCSAPRGIMNSILKDSIYKDCEGIIDGSKDEIQKKLDRRRGCYIHPTINLCYKIKPIKNLFLQSVKYTDKYKNTIFVRYN